MGSRQTESLSWWTQLAYFLFDSYAVNVQGAPGSRRALRPACLSADHPYLALAGPCLVRAGGGGCGHVGRRASRVVVLCGR